MTTTNSVLAAATQISSTLAFALPPPFGPTTAALAQVIGLFLNTGDTPLSKADLTQALNVAVQQIKDFLTQQQLVTQGEHIEEFLNGLIALQDTLDIPIEESLEQARDAASRIETWCDPDGRIIDAMTVLKDPARQLYNLDNGIPSLVLAASSYLMAMKMVVQLKATVAALETDPKRLAEANQDWLSAYDAFSVAVNGDGGSLPGWANIVDGILAKWNAAVSPETISEVKPSAVTDGSGDSIYQLGMTRGGPWTYAGWTFTHAATFGSRRCTELTHVVWEHWQGDDLGLGRQIAETNRVNYVAMIQDFVVSQTGGAADAIQQWRDGVATWSEHVAPAPPKTPPTIKGWKPLQGQEAGFTAAKVTYGIVFCNRMGPPDIQSSIVWSAPLGVEQGKRPMLELPSDPLQMADRREICRRFDGAEPKVVAVLTDNATTEWRDDSPS